MEINLNNKQKIAFNLMLNGKSIFITGMAGTGKTFLIKEYVKFFKKHNKKKIIGITSTTGISSLLINGVTLHSYLGIGLGKKPINTIISNIKIRGHVYKRWKDLKCLIIDEVSMLNPELFDKIENIARIIRNNTRPFGGIQLIISGDFCQLPCVETENFCFESNTWNICINETIYLDEIVRQDNIEFKKCLSEVRLNNMSEKTINMLKNECKEKKIINSILPTKLFSLNRYVNEINIKEMRKLIKKNKKVFLFKKKHKLNKDMFKNVKDVNKKYLYEKYKGYCPSDDIIKLTKNCQIMINYNLDQASKIVNGSRGIVIDFVDKFPKIKFMNGVERVIKYHTWDIKEDDNKIMEIKQLPIKIAYAFTIHKLQGSTLDCVEINFKNIFEYGQAYVALSRVKSLDGLKIINFNENVIKCHPKAKYFYDNLINVKPPLYTNDPPPYTKN